MGAVEAAFEFVTAGSVSSNRAALALVCAGTHLAAPCKNIPSARVSFRSCLYPRPLVPYISARFARRPVAARVARAPIHCAPSAVTQRRPRQAAAAAPQSARSLYYRAPRARRTPHARAPRAARPMPQSSAPIALRCDGPSAWLLVAMRRVLVAAARSAAAQLVARAAAAAMDSRPLVPRQRAASRSQPRPVYSASDPPPEQSASQASPVQRAFAHQESGCPQAQSWSSRADANPSPFRRRTPPQPAPPARPPR